MGKMLSRIRNGCYGKFFRAHRVIREKEVLREEGVPRFVYLARVTVTRLCSISFSLIAPCANSFQANASFPSFSLLNS